MANDKKKLLKLTTPTGIAKYPRLNKPETEVNGKTLDKPRFVVTLVLDENGKGVAELKAQLEKLHGEAVASADKARRADPKRRHKQLVINPVVKPHLDAQGLPIEGKFEITAKTNAETKEGAPRVLPIFDAKGKPTNAKVGSGSKIKLSISPDGYDSQMGAGLSLYLNGVQIIDLKSYGSGSASSFGFSEEKGYSAEEGGEEESGGNDHPARREDAELGGVEQAPARVQDDF